MPYASVFRPGLFAGETVVVTGGGSGIGRATAHELATLGARVVLVGRKPEKLRAVAAEIAADGGEADTAAFDIRWEEQVVPGVAAIVERHGRIHGLVNNAGGQFPSSLEKISQKGWETVLRTNLTGGFLMAREVYLQTMRGAGGGAIVNIIADMWRSMVYMGHSGAARAGMLNFTETAAVEWGPDGVRVNAVAPGWIASSGFDTYPPDMQAHIRGLPKHVPLRRIGLEAEVAAAIVFLLTPAAAFVSGSCIRVDGAAPNAPVDWPLRDGPGNAAFDGFHRAVRPKALDEPD